MAVFENNETSDIARSVRRKGIKKQGIMSKIKKIEGDIMCCQFA